MYEAIVITATVTCIVCAGLTVYVQASYQKILTRKAESDESECIGGMWYCIVPELKYRSMERELRDLVKKRSGADREP